MRHRRRSGFPNGMLDDETFDVTATQSCQRRWRRTDDVTVAIFFVVPSLKQSNRPKNTRHIGTVKTMNRRVHKNDGILRHTQDDEKTHKKRPNAGS